MPRPWNYLDRPGCIVLHDLELIAFLFVPLAIAQLSDASCDYGAAARTLASGEALRCGLRTHPTYEAERAAFIQALAVLARLPGGYQYGRLHFEATDG